MASTSTDVISGKVERIKSELVSVEKVFYISLSLYPIPPKETLDKVQSTIDALNKEIVNIKQALSDTPENIFFGDTIAALGQEIEILVRDIQRVIENSEPDDHASTAESQFTELTKEFASMAETLDRISLTDRDKIQACLRRMRSKKKYLRRQFCYLVETISLPENHTLFDQFNRAILEIFDKSKAIDQKMKSLAKEHRILDYNSEESRNETSQEQTMSERSQLTGLQENILKATDEKQLSKTILVYVDALRSGSDFLSIRERGTSKRTFAQMDEEDEFETRKFHMRRYEQRLDEREDALLKLRREIGAKVDAAEKVNVDVGDVKRRLKKHRKSEKLRPSLSTGNAGQTLLEWRMAH